MSQKIKFLSNILHFKPSFFSPYWKLGRDSSTPDYIADRGDRVLGQVACKHHQ